MRRKVFRVRTHRPTRLWLQRPVAAAVVLAAAVVAEVPAVVLAAEVAPVVLRVAALLRNSSHRVYAKGDGRISAVPFF